MATNTAGLKLEPWVATPGTTIASTTGTCATIDLGATPPPDIGYIPAFTGAVSGSPTVELYAFWLEASNTASPLPIMPAERFKHLIAPVKVTSANDLANAYVVPVHTRYLRIVGRRASGSGVAGSLAGKYQKRFPAQVS